MPGSRDAVRPPTGNDAVEPLNPNHSTRVRLPLTSRFAQQSLNDHARRNPGMVFIGSNGREYAVAGPWRHRQDIAELIELSTGPAEKRLVVALSHSLAARDVRLIVLDYSLAARDAAFFAASGFELIERIVEYERRAVELALRPDPPELVIRPYRPEDRESVLAVERQSFPWLWWNSLEEWGNYVWTKGVEVYVGCVGDEIVGYAGFVVYRRDGHLDRLAIHQSSQGRGYGAALLIAALGRMAVRGTTRVTLTTQADNLRSQRLYEQYGFQRARWSYEIHGLWLGQTKGPDS